MSLLGISPLFSLVRRCRASLPTSTIEDEFLVLGGLLEPMLVLELDVREREGVAEA